jgi:hypothetical protein
MRILRLLLPFLLISLIGCNTSSDSTEVLEDLQENLDFGNITTVIHSVDSLRKISSIDKDVLHVADSLSQIAERINLDFSVPESKVDSQIEKLIGIVSPQDRSEWEKNGWLEWRMIDGQKKYFNRAAKNLVLLKKFHDKNTASHTEIENTPEMKFRLKHTKEVLNSPVGKAVVPVEMEITYTITVHPDVIPDGEKLRCWLPWPKDDSLRQMDIKLISTSIPEYVLAPDTALHSTIYMESVVKKGMPTVFQVSFDYTSYGQHFNVKQSRILPYDKGSETYQKYTVEQLPHICFSDKVKNLADSITKGENDPFSIVTKIYSWFKENIPWAGALEYSTMSNIPEYVINNRKGDCGMQTYLFISMLRYKGIPARWQSGWMMPPGNENLHDWSEVYYEGIGWVPVDVSYDLQNTDNKLLKYFYLSGIDSYRLIVNSGVAGPLHPEKQFLRSEPGDFQRGEVEWKKGNLYFDKWDYNMNIKYIK